MATGWKWLGACIVLFMLTSCGTREPLKPSGTFRFEVNSVEPQERYTYSTGDQHTTVSASPGFALVILSFTATNDTTAHQRFSTEDIHVLDANRREVGKASFYGLGDSTPEGRGSTQLIRNWFYDEKDAIAATSRGKLNEAMSFVEWSLKPGKALTGTLVYSVPASAQGPFSGILALLEHQAPPPPAKPKSSPSQQL